MTTPHPSEDALERLEMGLLGPERARALREHLGGCPTCRTRAENLAAERKELESRTDPGVFARKVLIRAEQRAPARHDWRSWFKLGALLVPVAAAGLVLLLRPAPHPADDFYEGVKGSTHLQLFSPRGKVEDGAQVHPGEALRFVYSSPQAGYLLVAGLNERGELFPYYPLEGTESARVEAGSGVALPGSVVLDETLGQERFYLLVTERPLRVADLRDAVRAAGRFDLHSAQLPVKAAQDSLLVDKVAAK
jgi:hypothetical protein